MKVPAEFEYSFDTSMLHAAFSRRLISVPLYIHLPKSSYPSIFQRSISKSLPWETYNELPDFLDRLLRQCTTIRQCQQLHAQVFVTGSCRSAFLAARVVSTYAGFGFLDDARKAFAATPVECYWNLLLWNSILRANAAYEEYEELLRLYLRMLKLGVAVDGFTLPLVTRACASFGDSRLCKRVHGHVVQMGFQYHLHVVNELLGMYGKLGETGDARRVFDRMPVRSHISWNTMVSGYALNYDCDGAFEMFRRMELEGLEPNLVTWTSLLSSQAWCGRHKETLRLYGVMRKKGNGITAEALAVVISVCADLGALGKGEVIHGHVTKDGFEKYIFVKNSLISMYGKHGAVTDAEKLFMEIELKNVVSWNVLISSYADSGLCDEAFSLFSHMENSNEYSVVRPNVISWSGVIDGFASKGRWEESLGLFRRMQLAKVQANSITISSVLSVCAELSGLGLGREIHGHVIKAMMDRNVLVGNGLINMYAKCGSLKEAHLLFEKLDGRDVISWNTMIAGYGMHGLGNDALETFKRMVKAGYKPDAVTFVAVLSACSHAGLVNEGRELFNQMIREFRVQPQVEHYACIVDLLGRAGFFQEACNTMRSMPMEPNVYVWGALLNTCRLYKNSDAADQIASQILGLDLETTGSYMLLSNIYAAHGRWEDSARVRISTKVKGLNKIPGQSWIEVKKKPHMFLAGNTMQTGMEKVHHILKVLGLHMETEGYIPDRSFVPQYEGEELYA